MADQVQDALQGREESVTPPPNTDRLVPTKEACTMVGLSRWTVRRRVALGDFPKPIALAKNKNAFRVSALNQWIAARERQSTAPETAIRSNSETAETSVI